MVVFIIISTPFLTTWAKATIAHSLKFELEVLGGRIWAIHIEVWLEMFPALGGKYPQSEPQCLELEILTFLVWDEQLREQLNLTNRLLNSSCCCSQIVDCKLYCVVELLRFLYVQMRVGTSVVHLWHAWWLLNPKPLILISNSKFAAFQVFYH